ncbi:Cyclin-dependent kinases regulatory subunit 1 [Varanus komodoensis]|nr:Cyclin-dependent kinases regulatory subunit 1 [Varanus komodoensis]
MAHSQIYYSDKYDDEEFEYRHVMLPKDIAKLVPKTHLMSESEWRNLGVQQSQGWVHYMIHEPEPHILLFRRPLPKKPEKQTINDLKNGAGSRFQEAFLLAAEVA